MPMYANFLKEILSKRRKIDEYKTITSDEECGVVVLNKFPAKLMEPDRFSIPYLISNVSIDRVSINRAFCNLGSNVSLMPYSIFKKLDLRELRPINISLQLVDRSSKYPLGILEDVPIKVFEFYLPIDFLIMDMAKDACTQIICSRPFLATVNCKIDGMERKLTFVVGGDPC